MLSPFKRIPIGCCGSVKSKKAEEIIPTIIDQKPITTSGIVADLSELGVEPGITLMVHSSLRSIGWVVGGPVAVVTALLNVLGDDGTLVMPSATPQCSDPATWRSPRIAEDWLEFVRENLPVFDPDVTPTTMGAIPETLRNWPGAVRSDHPLESVCACGPAANYIVSPHPLAFPDSADGPFGRLHELEAWVLLLGVAFNRCTALHYAESQVENRRVATVKFPTIKGGRREWIEMPNVADDLDTHFPVVGANYLREGNCVRVGTIGRARSILFPLSELVAFAKPYFQANL